jgi:hypothetical protein
MYVWLCYQYFLFHCWYHGFSLTVNISDCDAVYAFCEYNVAICSWSLAKLLQSEHLSV